MPLAASRLLTVALVLSAALIAHAEVSTSSAAGFVSSFRKETRATPAQALDALGQVAQWWSPQHTYSGQSSNLRLTLAAGDCFCESWANNTIEHARVLLVNRERGTVRLDGALGPLQELGAKGILTFTAAAAEGQTTIGMTYRVWGAPDASLEKLAPIVDRVMGEQFGRWASFIDSRAP